MGQGLAISVTRLLNVPLIAATNWTGLFRRLAHRDEYTAGAPHGPAALFHEGTQVRPQRRECLDRYRRVFFNASSP